MKEEEPQAADDERLTLALRSLVDHDGPPDLRARVERRLNEPLAGGLPRPVWKWGYGVVLVAVVLVATAILWIERPDENVRHASVLTRPAVQEVDRHVPSPAGRSVASQAPSAEIARRRPREPRPAQGPPTFPRHEPAEPGEAGENLQPEWAPAALEAPAAITASDITPAPISLKASVLAGLNPIPALP